MASIKSSIQLVDGVTPKLERIKNALSKVTVSFEQLERATADAINTTKLNGAVTSTKKLENTVKGVNNELTKSNTKQKQSVSTVGRMTSMFNKLHSTLQYIVHILTKIEKKLKYANNSHFKLNQTAKQLLGVANQNAQAYGRIASGIAKATTNQNKFNQSAARGLSGSSKLYNLVRNLGAGYTGYQAFTGVLNTADQLTTATARIKLMNTEMENTGVLQEKIYQAAMRSRVSYLDMANVVSKLKMRVGDTFKTNDEAISFMETLNKMYHVAGASAEEIRSVNLQLAQAMGANVLRGDEFRSVMEGAPIVLDAIADYLGISAGKVKELAYDGKITADIMKNAMYKAADDVNKKFKELPITWSQVWTMIKNFSLKVFTPIFTAISKITQSKRFIHFANTVGNAMSKLAKAVKTVFGDIEKAVVVVYDAFANNWGKITPLMNAASWALKQMYSVLKWVADFAWKVGSWLVDKWSFIRPIMLGAAAALVVFKGAVIGAWIASKALAIWTGICNGLAVAMAFLKGIAAAATVVFTKATWAEIAAQWGLNAAMYACPLTWIILLIIAVIVVIYLAVAAINHFAGTSYSATGFIAGCFTTLGAWVWNNVAFMWNTFASFAEFLVNVFTNPIYSVKKLFVDLATNIIDCTIAMTEGCDEFATNFVNAILSAINVVLDGWNWLVDKLGFVGEKMGLGKATHFEARTSITSDLKNAKASLNALVADKPANYWDASKMEFKNVGEAYTKGYDWGKGIADKVGGVFDGDSYDYKNELKGIEDILNGKTPAHANQLNDIGKALSGTTPNTGTTPGVDNSPLNKISKDTGKISDTLDSNNDLLKYMRMSAEREAINRYQLTDLKVEMTNNNKIGSKVDADGLMMGIAKQIIEAAKNNAKAAFSFTN